MYGVLIQRGSMYKGFFYFRDCHNSRYCCTSYFKPNLYIKEGAGWINSVRRPQFKVVLPEEFM